MQKHPTYQLPIFSSLWPRSQHSMAILSVIAKQTRDARRKAMHSFKVGLAITISSLIYYLEPLYKNFGEYAMWSIVTVVVVSQFSVGATLGKGINRVLATLVAGVLAVGVHYLAILTGKTREPIFVALFVFLLTVTSTFIRFFPKVKARYDYGMMMIILTFCLVLISGYQTDDVVIFATQRLLTILIGASISVIVSVFISPVWAGEELHNLTAQHLDELGKLMEVFAECLIIPEQADTGSAKVSISTLNDILVDSKIKEETLANFATWEPGHGRFMYRHPWKQYLKIGHLTRQCGFRVQALNSFSNFITQAQQEIKLQGVILEAGNLLRELALAITTVTKPSSINPHMNRLKNMKTLLKSVTSLEDPYSNLRQIMPFTAVDSLVIEIVTCVESIADAVNELGVLAKFKSREKRGIDMSEVPSNFSTGEEEEPLLKSDTSEDHPNNIPPTEASRSRLGTDADQGIKVD